MKNAAGMLFVIGVSGWFSGCGPGILGECSNSCSPPGSTQCADGEVRTCMTGVGGCLGWSGPTACPFGTCLDEKSCGECIPDCSGLQCGLDPVCGKEDCGDCSEPTPICGSDGQCKPPTASGITINPDKTIGINGKKTFPVYMYGICFRSFEEAGWVTPCDVSKNPEFTFGGYLFAPVDAYWKGVRAQFESNKIFYVTRAATAPSLPEPEKVAPFLFGYMACDEPPDGTEEWPDHADQSACESANSQCGGKGVWKDNKCYRANSKPMINSAYLAAKAADPNHPVIQNHWKDMTTWDDDADIVTWDTYTISDDSRYWTRGQSIYAWEHYSRQNFIKANDFSATTKPVFAVLQGNGLAYGGGSFGRMQPPTQKEIRAMSYTAITMGVNGIGYFGYISSYPVLAPTKEYPSATAALYTNPAMRAYYGALATEIRGLNDILVLPTKDYRWEYRSGTEVSFNKSLEDLVLWTKRTNFNYILKESGGVSYLIVVNKDSRPISDVEIEVVGLRGRGPMTAKTLGLETTGSSKAGEMHAVTDGKFTDSFDDYAVHIYEIAP